MYLRHLSIAAAAVAAITLAVPASALMQKQFSGENLAAAQKAGKPILVEVSAPWCPTCKAQKTVLSELAKQDRFKTMVKLEVDFDSQKADLKELKATKQSTLIVYKGTAEVGRSVGETNAKAIEDLLAKAL